MESAITLAEKIDRLFRTVYPRGRREYTHEEVVDAIRERGGPSMSPAYLWQLRRGRKDNPTKRHLEALADFFKVSPAYFFDDESANLIHAQLGLLAAMRDAQIRHIAARAAQLSPEALDTVTEIVERLRRLQGLPDDRESAPTAAHQTGQERDE